MLSRRSVWRRINILERLKTNWADRLHWLAVQFREVGGHLPQGLLDERPVLRHGLY
jgi:hypothetical protein